MPQQNESFDFTGFRLFGEIAAILEAGGEPTVGEWDALFGVPGYAALTRSEFSREMLTDRLRIACSPRRAAEREAMLTTAKSMILSHFVDVRRRWPELCRAADRIAGSSLQAEAAALACRLLPRSRPGGDMASLPAPPVSFVVFINDARGYEPVVMDIAMAAALSERELMLILAHEFHHNYRNRILTYRAAAAPAGTHDLLWVLDQLQAEGIADLINVPETIYGPDVPPAYGQVYRDGVAAAPAFIAELDQTLALLDATRSGNAEDVDAAVYRQTLGATLRRALPMAGHPTGYYMATTVVANGLTGQLVDTVGNPLCFLSLFHQSALAAGLSGFSPPALAFLEWLATNCAC